MADTIQGRVFDASTAGWIADLMVSVSVSGTGYLKEASLGSDFVWNNGLLDVSVISTDASVQDLYNYIDDLSTYVYSHSHAQDASIADLYNEIANLPQDASIAVLKRLL